MSLKVITFFIPIRLIQISGVILHFILGVGSNHGKVKNDYLFFSNKSI